MADIMSTFSIPPIGQRAKTLTQLVTLRLMTGYTLLTISCIGMLGTDWDIQWHSTVGRDRTFTPPHDVILVTLGLNGIVALTSILIETWWSGRHRELAQNSTDFLGMLRSSLGSYFVGFGVVCTALAFPLDTYWHALYGIDVTLWAPFHTMLYMGGVLATFGIIYLLLSAAHLAQSQQQVWKIRLGYAGVIITLALLLSKLTTFLIPSVGLSLGGMNISPFLLSVCVAFVCTLAVRVVRWPGTVTLLILVFLIMYFLVSAFVPPLMTWLIQAEHQTYLPGTTFQQSIVVPLISQSPWLLLTGLSIDGIIFLGRRLHWSPSRINWRIAGSIALSTMIVSALILIGLGNAQSSGSATSDSHSAILFFVLALALAVPGTLLGSWFGGAISKMIAELRS
jgi:hypothetical protein